MSFLGGRLRAKASKEASGTDKRKAVSEPLTPCDNTTAAGSPKKPKSKIKQAVHYCFNFKSRRKSPGSPSRRSVVSGMSGASGASSTAQPLLTMRGLVIRNPSHKSTVRELATSAPPHAGSDSEDEKGIGDVATFSYLHDRIEQTKASSGYKPRAREQHSRYKRTTRRGTRGLASEIGHKGAKGDMRTTLEEDDTALENSQGDACTLPYMTDRFGDREKCDAKSQSSQQELSAGACSSLTTPSALTQSAEDVVQESNSTTKNEDLEAFNVPASEESTPATCFPVDCEDDEVETTKNSPPESPLFNASKIERTRTCILFVAASEENYKEVVTPKSSSAGSGAGDVVNISRESPNNFLVGSPTSTTSSDTLNQSAVDWLSLLVKNDGSPNNFLGCSPASTASTDTLNQAADESGWVALLTKNDLTTFSNDSANSSSTELDDVVSPHVITTAVRLESIPEEANEGSTIPTSSLTPQNVSDQPSDAEATWVQRPDNNTTEDSSNNAKNANTQPTDTDSFNDIAHHSDSEKNSRVQTPEGSRCPSTASGFEQGERGTSTAEIAHLDNRAEPSCAELRISSVSAGLTSRNDDADDIVSDFFCGREISVRDALHESVPNSSPKKEVMQPAEADGETAILGDDGQAGESNANQREPAAVSDQPPESAEGPYANATDACGLPTEMHIAETNQEHPTSDAGSKLQPMVTSALIQSRSSVFGVQSLNGRNSGSVRTRRLVRYEDTHTQSTRMQMSLKRRRPRSCDDCRMKLHPSSILGMCRREAAIAPLMYDTFTQTDVSKAVPGPSVSTQTLDASPSSSFRHQPSVIPPWVLLSYAAVLMVVAHCLGAWISNGKP